MYKTFSIFTPGSDKYKIYIWDGEEFWKASIYPKLTYEREEFNKEIKMWGDIWEIYEKYYNPCRIYLQEIIDISILINNFQIVVPDQIKLIIENYLISEKRNCRIDDLIN